MASRDLRNAILMSVSISKVFCFKFDDNITDSVYLVGQCLNLSSSLYDLSRIILA